MRLLTLYLAPLLLPRSDIRGGGWVGGVEVAAVRR